MKNKFYMILPRGCGKSRLAMKNILILLGIDVDQLDI